MDLGSLRTLALELNFSAHGVPATVTPVDEAEIATRVIWVTPLSELEPAGGEFTRREPIRILAVRRSDVPRLPRGSRVVAPETSGDSDQVWRVDGTDRIEADHHRVLVVKGP